MNPTIEWIRDGVGFTPAAAASFRRAEIALGRRIGVNSSYRDYQKQLGMWKAWNRYRDSGFKPSLYPGHSRAIHPDLSIHCRGCAVDSNDWTRPGFNSFIADHGWIRTAAGDPTEQHHFEYQSWRDRRAGEGPPAGAAAQSLIVEPEEDDMNPRQIHCVDPRGKVLRALLVPGTGYFVKWTETGATYANGIARNMETGSSTLVTVSLFQVFEREAAAQRPKGALAIEIADADD